MIKVRNTELLQENILDMTRFALEHDFINFTSEPREFMNIFTSGCSGPLTLSDLEKLVEGTQEFVRMPVYTTEHAAAWLGVGIDTLRDAIWRSGKVKTMKPGHDVLIVHGELVRFRDSRN